MLSSGLKLPAMLLLAGLVCLCTRHGHGADFSETCRKVWPRVVKIFGAGGIRGLHSYSSGILVSPDGHILTVWNHVLETDGLRAVLSDGQRFDAELQLVDTSLEAAIIKIDAQDLPHFDLENAPSGRGGEWVLGLSNAYKIATGNEKPTVIHGVISAVTTLRARKGVFESNYGGQVYVLDGIMNSPGSGGGALTNYRGKLLGMIGRQLKSKGTNTWLNYAVPSGQLLPLVRRALKGERTAPFVDENKITRKYQGPQARHGLVLVPNVLKRTPAYIDRIEANSPAAKARLKADDLVLFLDETFIGTCANFEEAMSEHQPGDKVKILVKRGEELYITQLTLE